MILASVVNIKYNSFNQNKKISNDSIRNSFYNENSFVKTISPLVSFKSNEHREKELAELRRIQAERDKISREVINSVVDTWIYPKIDDNISVQMAGFLSKFVCAIQNSSEHDIQEFFADEQTAHSLRKNLSPQCQYDSIELRNEIQKTQEIKDPVMMLIAANNMKRFVPKAGILSPTQHTELIEGLKNIIVSSIKNSDMSEFDTDEKILIGEMMQMVKASDDVNFGISVKLKRLVDRLNKKRLQLNYIPPVQIRQLQSNSEKLQYNNLSAQVS